jgi:hypothetical protein
MNIYKKPPYLETTFPTDSVNHALLRVKVVIVNTHHANVHNVSTLRISSTNKSLTAHNHPTKILFQTIPVFQNAPLKPIFHRDNLLAFLPLLMILFITFMT